MGLNDTRMYAFDLASRECQGENVTNIVKFPLETNYKDAGTAENMN